MSGHREGLSVTSIQGDKIDEIMTVPYLSSAIIQYRNLFSLFVRKGFMRSSLSLVLNETFSTKFHPPIDAALTMNSSNIYSRCNPRDMTFILYIAGMFENRFRKQIPRIGKINIFCQY